MPPLPASSATLIGFIYRSQALALYRSFVREIRGHRGQAELRSEVRAAFERNRYAEGPAAVKFLLSDGRQQLKQLRDMLGLQR